MGNEKKEVTYVYHPEIAQELLAKEGDKIELNCVFMTLI